MSTLGVTRHSPVEPVQVRTFLVLATIKIRMPEANTSVVTDTSYVVVCDLRFDLLAVRCSAQSLLQADWLMAICLLRNLSTWRGRVTLLVPPAGQKEPQPMNNYKLTCIGAVKSKSPIKINQTIHQSSIVHNYCPRHLRIEFHTMVGFCEASIPCQIPVFL